MFDLVPNRRVKRSDDVKEALELQLVASKERARFSSIVLSDDAGLVIALAGNRAVGEQIAAYSPLLVGNSKTWHGTMRTNRGPVRVSVAPVRYKGSHLYLSATEGTGSEIPKELFTSGRGVLRILG